MPRKVLLAHAEAEETLAEQVATFLRVQGYEVAHSGTVMVGESLVQEVSKLLADHTPVILCGTVRAMGTGWAHKIVNAAHKHPGVPIYALRVDREAYLDSVLLDGIVGNYWVDAGAAMRDLGTLLERHFDTATPTCGLRPKSQLQLPKVSLPPRGRCLYGRSSDRRAIHSLLRAGFSGRRILVHGLPGVGKSAIVTELAHQVARKKIYELVLWLDCDQAHFVRGEISASPTSLRTLPDILREISISLSSDAAMRVPPADAARVLRAQLRDFRCLLVFDSLDSLDDASVEAFIRSLPDSIDVVATARRSLSWQTSYELRPLPNDDADTRVLASKAMGRARKHSAGALDTMLAACAGIPQTMIWFGALADQGWDSDEIVKFMSSPDSTLTRYYFEKHWQEISTQPLLSRAAALVALFRMTAEKEVASALGASGSHGKAMNAISRLHELHILERAGGALSVTPASREYIAAKVQGSQLIFHATSLLWLRHVATKAAAAQAGRSWPRIFDQLEASRSDLIAALRLARDTSDAEIIDAAAPVLTQSIYYLFSKGLWNEALDVAALVEERQASPVDEVVEVCLIWAVRIVRRRHGVGAAADYFDRVERALRRRPQLLSEEALAKLRVAQLAVRDIATDAGAAAAIADADALLAIGNVEWACRAMLQAGNYFSDHAQETRARDAFSWILTNAHGRQAAWATELVAIAHGSLGILASRAKDYPLAINLLDQSIAVAQLYDRMVIHAELARAYALVRKPYRARKHVLESSRYAAILGVTGTIMETEPGWDQRVGAALAARSKFEITLQSMLKRVPQA
jgi:hypothetical protein